MLTGELRSKIDNVWNAFWAGGIANPIEVIEQITYLLFIRGLDEAHTREENKANRLKRPIARRIFPAGKDDIGKGGGVAYEDMRWSRLKNCDPATMFALVSEHVLASHDRLTFCAFANSLGVSMPSAVGVFGDDFGDCNSMTATSLVRRRQTSLRQRYTVEISRTSTSIPCISQKLE